MNGRYPDHQPPQPPVFPSLAGAFPGYIPGTHSYLSSSPRFPYNISTRTHQGYIPGSVVHGPSPYITQDRSNPPSVFSRSSHEFPHVPERRSYVPDATRRYRAQDNVVDHDPVVFNAGFTFRLGQEAVVHKHVDVQPAYSIPEAPSANLSRQIDKFLKKSDHTLDRYSSVIKSRSSSRVSGQRGRSLTPGGTLDTSPDRSLNLSCRAQRSTSAASIAVKAEKHLEALSLSVGPKARKTAPIAEREEDNLGSSSSNSFDEFDTDEDVLRSGEVFDISDDTSADLSKLSAIEVDGDTHCSTPFDRSRLDDLSSDSDDEYFDVVPLPGLRPPPLPSSPAPASPATKPQIPPHLPPTHSQSLPSVNKSLAAGKMGNFQGQTAATAKPPETTNATHGNSVQQTLANSMTQQIVPNASPGGTLTRTSSGMVTQQPGDKVIIPHKKYQAPQPPSTRSGLPYKQDDTHSLKSLPATTNEHPYTAALVKSYAVRDPSVSSLVDKVGTDLSSPGKDSVAASSESLTTYATRDNKIGKDTLKARRVPSFKKYPAPQPPGSSSRPSSTLIKDPVDGSSLATTSLTSLTSLSSYQSLKTESTKVSKEDLVQPSSPFGVSAFIANKKPLSSEAQPVTVETQNNTTTTSVHSSIKHLDTNNVDGKPTGHKVRAGSPVPDMPAVKDLTAKKAVLKGKLEIATNDGSAIVKTETPEEGKVALQIKGPKVNKDAKTSEPGKVELDEKISNKTPILGKKERQSSTGKKEEILVNGFKDDAPLKTHDEKSHDKSAPEVSKKAEKQKYSKINEKTDSTKDNNIGSKTSEPQVNGDCDEVNTAKEKDKASKNKDKSKQKSSVGDKNNEATKVTDEKLCNGVHVEGEPTTDKDDKKVKHKSKKTSQSKENISEVNSERESRCNSVASDISSAVTPDVSQKSVYKRTKSGKLASVLNKFEAEDVSQASEKSKPKSSAPKVGKITGLASKFEGGTPVAPKLDITKIKSPYSGPFSPERKAPEPKTKDIAGINMAKFGSLAKFKKQSLGDKKEDDEKTKEEEVKTNDEKEKTKDEKEKTKEMEEKLKDEKEISKNEKKKVKTKEDKSATSASSKSDLEKMNVDKEVTCKKDGKEGNIVNLKEKTSKETEDSKKTDVKENKKKASTGDQNYATAGKQEIVPLVNGEVSIAESSVSSSDKKKKTKTKTDPATDVTTSATLTPKSPESKKKLDDKASVISKTADSESVKDKSEIATNKKIKLEPTEVVTEESKTQDKISEAQNVESKVSVPNDVIVKPSEQTVKSFEANKSEGVKIIVNKSPSGNDKEKVETKEESESSKVEKLATIKTEIHEPVTLTHDNNVRSDVNKEPVIIITEDAVTKAVEPKVTDSKSPTSEEVAKESVVVSDGPAVVEKVCSEEISIIISTDASVPKTLAKNVAEDATVLSANSTTHNVAAVDSALALAQPGNHSAASDLAAGDKPIVSAEILSVRPKSLDPLKKESQSTNDNGKVESLEQLKQDSLVSDINKVQSVNVDTCVGALSVRPRESSVTSEFSVDNMSRGSVYKYLEQDMTAMSKIDEKPNHNFSRATCDIRRKINEAIARTSTVLPQLESQVQAIVREASTFLETGMAGARASVSPCRAMSPLACRAASSGEDDDEVFEDAVDPSQLDTLMPLPDVPAERERRSRSRTPLLDGPERSSSAKCLVAQTEALLSETDRLLRRSRSDKSLRLAYTRSLSSAALNKSAQDVIEARYEVFANEIMMTRNLAEVTADLSEEHNTAHLAGERLEAEQAERMKLEKEVERLHENVRAMTTANGRLEEERQVLKSEVLRSEVINGDAHDDDDDEEHDASLYKRKYQWSLREMELLKKQLKQQQEDDLDHLLLLKKQLEKKVADAYEETEEQRQVVAQMKRKSQRLQAEMNDLKILLEEQTSRNNLLEKKQRKFDQDMLVVQEELRHEKTNKDKIQREKDQILSEKYSYEQEVSTLKLELELKEEKVASLSRELADLSFTGRAEEEVAALKKAKHDLDMRVKDQEEELDDLAGQVQMLEGARVRLEMSIEQMRKENRREVSQREEELEEVRISAQKKAKALESQLESEHEERTLVVREKHELERRLAALQDRSVGHVEEEYVVKLKKELKKTKALLRDTQTMLENTQSEGGHKLMLRQLKTQLEDAEFAKTAAIKARQSAESDLSELGSQLEEAQRSRKEAEDRCARVAKDRSELQTQLEESEEEVAEVMKKYKAVVSQLSVDQITLSEQSQQIAELEHEKQVLQDRLVELSSKVEVLEGETANIHTQRRLEMKIKEVESKLELEQTTRQRLESQIGRLKDQIERLTAECDSTRVKESQAVEQSRRTGRQLREVREDLASLQQKYTDAASKKGEVEKQLELADSEVITLKSDLKLAFKRIEDLQQAIQGDLNDSDSDLSDSDSDTDGSLSSYLTASLKHQRSSSNSTLRTPPSEVHQLDRLEQAASPSSEGMSAISEDLEDTAGKESFA